MYKIEVIIYMIRIVIKIKSEIMSYFINFILKVFLTIRLKFLFKRKIELNFSINIYYQYLFILQKFCIVLFYFL